MAQVIPPITSLADSNAGSTTEDIQDRLPSICVDYLSHNWTEEDVWASWRSMTRHKHEIANGVRLENASWRTWNKQRNKLRTISPETLNWLKDSDVTWLYGPLHTANVEPVRPLKISSTDDRLGIDRPAGKPGILKHRTLTELLSMNNTTSLLMDDEEEEEAAIHAADVAAAEIQRRPLIHTKSDTNLTRSNSLPARRRSPSVARRIGATSKDVSPDNAPASNKRHISFNTFVEQRIALDEPVIRRSSNDSDFDDVLEMRRTSRYTLARTVSDSSIIAKIQPGVLKTSGSFTKDMSLPKLVYMPPIEYRSPSAEQPPATIAPFKVVAAQPGIQRWNNVSRGEDYTNHVGFDYFGGPDLTSGSPSSSSASSFGRAPSVQTPPAQPKWRQPSTDPSASSSSSSSSSLNGLVNQQPQQPQRSILKVRPANPKPSTSPEPVSPPVIFNYNPSVATGIGGMFGGYDGAAQAGIAIGSPPPNDREERGRSTSRGNGSSQYDRSTSRTSVASSTSSHSSVSRSPAETTIIKSGRNQPSLDKVREGVPWPDAAEPMDVDDCPERPSRPTQIVPRPLKDTSPNSIPNSSVRSPGPNSDTAVPATATATAPAVRGAVGNHNSGAASPPLSPILSQPVYDDDGSTLIGRATNIANTAKDLLGALWYGQDDSGRPRQPGPRRG